jgi:hypothetical protein
MIVFLGHPRFPMHSPGTNHESKEQARQKQAREERAWQATQSIPAPLKTKSKKAKRSEEHPECTRTSEAYSQGNYEETS